MQLNELECRTEYIVEYIRDNGRVQEELMELDRPVDTDTEKLYFVQRAYMGSPRELVIKKKKIVKVEQVN